jgi:hypothetical protein
VKIQAAVLQQVHEENLTVRRRYRRGTDYRRVCADYLSKEQKKILSSVEGCNSTKSSLVIFSVDSANSWTWSITPCSHVGGDAQMFVRRLLFAKIWLLQSDDIWHFVSLWRCFIYSPVQEFVRSFQETLVNILYTVDSDLSRDPQNMEFALCRVWTTTLMLLK